MPTREAIEQRLLEHVAQALDSISSAIDRRATFDALGLTSRDAATLTGDLQEWLGHDILPSVLYDYPTIELLSAYLAGEVLPPRIRAPQSSAASTPNSPIALVGMACRVPGAATAEAFWDLLVEGRDAVTEVPPERWDAGALYDADPDASGKTYSRWGAFLDDIDCFDAEFFGISPREALRMDPQQRLLLQVAWEALENAGIPPSSLARDRAGAFVGICNNDYARVLEKSEVPIDGFASTGNAQSIAANRLAYAFDLNGPSYAIDAACASSLVAVHHACASLRSGECRVAIVAGVNALLRPEPTIALSHGRMLSPEGRCKTFDAQADGYVRGEGCGVVILKRLEDARRDGDSIVAVIRGSATNHGGRSNGLTAPNRFAQEEAIATALAQAEIEPREVGFVETQGTGTLLGDAIEVEALVNVLGQGREDDRPCRLGALKTNIGHLEGASGIVSLIKAALALHYKTIPANLHLNDLNPNIRLGEAPFRFPTTREAWNDEAIRVAGVNAFGFGGSNAHVVLEAFEPDREIATGKDRPWHVLALSAKSETALTRTAQRLAKHFENRPDIDIADAGYSLNGGREHFEYRLAVVARSVGEAVELLHAYDTKKPREQIHSGRATAQSFPRFDSFEGADGENRTEEDWKASVMSLASLYVRGVEIDWRAFDRPYSRTQIYLPNYPFEKRRFWPRLKQGGIPEPQGNVLVSGDNTLAEYWGLEPERRPAMMQDLLRHRLSRILEVSVNSIEPHANLVELGLDSLMMMELAAHIERDWRIAVGRGSLLRDATVGKLARDLCDAVNAAGRDVQPGISESRWDVLGALEEGRV